MTQDLTTTSILALFQTTKSERESFVNDILSKVENGEINPLTIHLQLKCAEDIVKQITSNDKYTDILVEESQKQGQKSFQFHNAKFEIKEVGVKYTWDKCNDPLLAELLAAQEELDKKVKDRQNMLKTISVEGIELIHGDELVRVYPPPKSSKTNVAVTLK